MRAALESPPRWYALYCILDRLCADWSLRHVASRRTTSVLDATNCIHVSIFFYLYTQRFLPHLFIISLGPTYQSLVRNGDGLRIMWLVAVEAYRLFCWKQDDDPAVGATFKNALGFLITWAGDNIYLLLYSVLLSSFKIFNCNLFFSLKYLVNSYK